MFDVISEYSVFFCVRVLANSSSIVCHRGLPVDFHCHFVDFSGIIMVVAASVLTSFKKRVASRGVAPFSKQTE